MPIRLFDSLSREQRELKPAHADGVYRFYNCGPTVYAPAHIGNFRTFVVNDVLRRLLELEFGPTRVKHVRNLTDVDDKTIRRAREEGRALAAVTRQWTDKFHADCDALNCLRPHVEPTATGHIREQVDMIDVLMQKGNAYRAADGSVYFKVSSFDGYGRLSRVKERELQLGSALSGKPQAADADEKEDVSDFALWKAHKPEDGDNAWDSPWGRGRPGWHIECSAMSKKHLGETIDLHTGGVDLLFPHHENEIAQSECCNGREFSRHWYHSEHLLVDGKKMSKSLGNLYTLDDLVAKGYWPMSVRFALLAAHPRKQLNFTLDGMRSAAKRFEDFSDFARLLRMNVGSAIAEEEFFAPLADNDWGPFSGAWHALCNDLNLPEALGLISTVRNRFVHNPDLFFGEEARATLSGFRKIGYALGFKIIPIGNPDDAPAGVSALAKMRLAALQSGNLNEANQLKAAIQNEGWSIIDIPAAFTLVSIPEQVRALAEKRWAAKAAKDFAAADALRKDLAAAGWTMLDRKDGYSLEPAKK